MADQKNNEQEEPQRTSIDEERIRGIAAEDDDLDEDADFDEEDTEDEEEGSGI